MRKDFTKNRAFVALPRPSFFTILCSLVMMLLQFTTANAQISSTDLYACNNCTSGDVKIESIELVSTTLNPAYHAVTNPNVDKYLPLPTSCTDGTTINAYVKITINQNAGTRWGMYIAGDIWVDNIQGNSFSSCDNKKFEKKCFG